MKVYNILRIRTEFKKYWCSWVREECFFRRLMKNYIYV